jgi:hypothetical protein
VQKVHWESGKEKEKKKKAVPCLDVDRFNSALTGLATPFNTHTTRNLVEQAEKGRVQAPFFGLL